MIARDGSNGGQAGEPVFPRADGFGANVGEHEIDGRGHGIGVGVEAQQFVGRGVRTWSVRAHAEAVGDRLESLPLFVNAMTCAPPPSLMNKWAVRRVHKADEDRKSTRLNSSH